MTQVKANNGKGLKVLVIEDDTLTRLALCRLLQNMDYQTIEACNGHMGLVCFRRERPDLVITDIVMPDKEGFATIREIRALDPAARIVAISSGSADGRIDLLQVAEEMGAIGSLKKPIQKADVSALLSGLAAQ